MKWNETPMLRYARCPVHGCLAIMRWTRRGWRWSHGCAECLGEADNFTSRGPFDMVEAE